MTELQEEYPTALVMGTDGGAFPDGTAAGYGVTIGRLTAPFQKLSANCYEEQHELHGPVELDPDSKVFLGAKKLTNHTAELSGMCMALIYLLTVSNSVSEVIILYDAATDAAAIAGSGGDGGMSEDIHTGKRRQTPNQNGALISTGQQLLKLVIAAGVKVLWCKVKGHSQDAINDRADALATDGRDAVTEPRGLELASPHQLHTVENWLTRSAGPEVAAVLTDALTGYDNHRSGVLTNKQRARRIPPARREFDNQRQWQGAVQQWELAHQEAETMRNIPPTALQRKLALRGAGEEEIAAWYAAPPLAQRNWAMHCGIHGLFGYAQDSEEDGEQQHTQVGEEDEQYTQVDTDTVVETKHWEVLGLQPGASSREVTTAYRTLSRQHHPDKAGNSEEANRVMGELAAANAAIQSSLDTDLEIGEFLD